MVNYWEYSGSHERPQPPLLLTNHRTPSYQTSRKAPNLEKVVAHSHFLTILDFYSTPLKTPTP